MHSATVVVLFCSLTLVASCGSAPGSASAGAANIGTLGRVQERNLVGSSLEKGDNTQMRLPIREAKLSTQRFPESRIVSVYENLIVLEDGEKTVVRTTSGDYAVGQCVRVAAKGQAVPLQVVAASGCRP